MPLGVSDYERLRRIVYKGSGTVRRILLHLVVVTHNKHE